MKEMPSHNKPVQRPKVAILPLDLPCSGLVTHSREFLTTGKSHKKKLEGLFPKDVKETKKNNLLIKQICVLMEYLLK
jgi:hypothetical protein